MHLTQEKILQLAPDAASIDRAKSLTTVKKWRNLEGNAQLVWGECKSSGVVYYKTQLLLKEAHSHCNCPSSKYPCKHALALMQLFVQDSGVFRITDTLPTWVQKWLDQRANGVELSKGRTPEQERQLAEQRLKTRAKRLFQMTAGFKELEVWLTDLLRQGLANLEGQGGMLFQEISARMVNAKLGGLARRIRNLESIIGKEGWHEQLLETFGELYLMVKGYEHLEKLPPPLQQELLNVAGINYKKEELLLLEGIEDTWLVIGQKEGNDEENLFYRRTWVMGATTHQICLFLDFAWAQTPYSEVWKVGTQWQGAVVYYPSTYPLRAVVKAYKLTSKVIHLQGFANLTIFAEGYADAVAANPWLSIFPAFLEEVVPVYFQQQFYLLDKDQKQLPISDLEEVGWKMLALSGGHPISVFGEWDGKLFFPMTAVANDGFHLLKNFQPLPRPTRNWQDGNNWF